MKKPLILAAALCVFSLPALCFDSPQGVLDYADCNIISGWAWDTTLPNTPISVDIYDGTFLIATVQAANFRQDLLNAGIGNGSHGYTYAPPAILKDGKPHALRVQFAGSPTLVTFGANVHAQLQRERRLPALLQRHASFHRRE